MALVGGRSTTHSQSCCVRLPVFDMSTRFLTELPLLGLAEASLHPPLFGGEENTLAGAQHGERGGHSHLPRDAAGPHHGGGHHPLHLGFDVEPVEATFLVIPRQHGHFGARPIASVELRELDVGRAPQVELPREAHDPVLASLPPAHVHGLGCLLRMCFAQGPSYHGVARNESRNACLYHVDGAKSSTY